MRFGILLLSMAIASFSFVSAKSSPAEQYRKAMSLLIANASQADQNDALDQLRLAADQGYAPAESSLGTIYQQGLIVAQDVPTAITWFKKAADQGDWIAQFSLGRIYFFGGPVPSDTATARRWFEQAAADPRDSGASFYLGLLNDEGQGTPTNYPLAAKWYRQSAERGNPFAMERLALLLLKGVAGTSGQASREEAYVFLLVAADLGNHHSDLQVSSIEADLGKNGADSARRKALDLRDRVLGYAGQKCNGWEGQYSQSPTSPPLTIQEQCERQ